jgi:O-succinylbenzoate synthase
MRRLCIPDIVERESEIGAINPATWWSVEGHFFAKHAIESALWDIEARARGVSLSQLLGGTREQIRPGVVIGLADTIDEVLNECVLRLNEGYQRLKIKIEPGRDSEVLRAVRACVGDDVVLQEDANGAYGSVDIDALSRLSEFNLQFIEQPFAADDVQSHIQLSRVGAIAVCMDESICSSADLEHMVSVGACSIVNVKPSRVGGIGEARVMHDIAHARGIDAWVGGMLETGIGRASCLALASLPGFTLTPDLSASKRYFARDITEPFVLHEGVIRVPTQPGIGVVPREDVLCDASTVIETVYEQ